MSWPYRCFFYAGDREELAQIYVERAGNVPKFWLGLVMLAGSGGFRSTEIERIQRLVEEHREHLPRSWNEFFND